MSETIGGSPASWHADPTGRHQLRYWDGTAWTDNVSDDGAQSTDHLPGAPPTARLASEDVVVSAPMSFAGSAQRIWKITRSSDHPAAKVILYSLAVTGVVVAWVVVACWYVIFSILLIPFRLIRRGSRKRKREALQHREQLEAIQAAARQLPPPPR